MLRSNRVGHVRGAAALRFPIRRHAAAEQLEGRLLLAAHIVGSSTVYSTIQAAVNAAVAGATINVDAGTYGELVTIPKTLTVRGAQAGVDARSNTRGGGSESVLTGANLSGSVSSSFYVAANDVTLDGFTVQGNTSSGQYGAGIVIAPGKSGTHIVNDIVQNNIAGIYLANTSSTDQTVIQHDLIRNNNNPGDNSGRGIYSDYYAAGGNLTNVLIDSNTFIDNYGSNSIGAVEAAVSLESTTPGSQSNITVSNNVMDGNGKGTLMYDATGIVIKGNTVTNSLDTGSAALRFEGGMSNVTIQSNVAWGNGNAIRIDNKAASGSSSGFVINSNDIYNNAAGLVVDTYTGTLDARSNWWGSASGPGGDGPGTGDAIQTNGNSVTYSPWSTVPNINQQTVPSPPTKLVATAASSSQISLTWIDNSTNETGFKIDRSTDGVNFTTITSVGANVTQYSDTGLASSTTYYYRVRATNSYGDSSNSNIASDTTEAPGLTEVPLSSLPWISATIGWGKIGINTSVGGNPLTLGRTVYPKGIGTHAVSQIVYNLGGTYSNFLSTIGIDDEEAGQGSVDFQVLADGKKIYDSGVMLGTTTPKSFNLNVTGVQQLTLYVGDAGDGIDCDHADWAGATLLTGTTPTVPAAPSNLTAAAVAANQINLAWTDNSNNETGFKIERSANGTSFTQINTVGANVTTYSDTTVVAGTTYSYRVRATNSVGDSSYSNTAVAAPLVPPAAPSGLAAAAVSATQVNLGWTDNSTNAASIFIERSTDNVHFSQIGSVGGNATTYSDNSTVATTTYYYRVRASNAAGTSAYSNVASVTTPAAASVTTYLSDLQWASATIGWGSIGINKTVSGNTISLRKTTYAKGIGTHAVSQIVYNLNGQYTSFLSDVGVDDEVNGNGAVDFQVLADGVKIYDSGVLTGTSPVASLNLNVGGVKQLTLIATNGIAGTIDYDHADWAGARLLSTPSAPAAPTSVTVQPFSSSQLNLTWTPGSTNQTGFQIDRSTDGTSFTTIASVAGNVTSYQDKGLTASTKYYYRLRATNAVGSSVNSTVVSATTLAATATTTYLSDLQWVSATTGWGTIGINKTVKGNTISLRGTTYAKGIGTHAVSQIVYNLNGQYSTFLSDIGVDDEVNGQGAVDFQVLADGVKIFDSGVLTGTSPVASLSLNVTGVKQLTLIATNGIAGTIDYDHADWAGARLLS